MPVWSVKVLGEQVPVIHTSPIFPSYCESAVYISDKKSHFFYFKGTAKMTSQLRIIKINWENLYLIWINVNEKCMHLICNTNAAVTNVTFNDNAQPRIRSVVTNKPTTVKYAEKVWQFKTQFGSLQAILYKHVNKAKPATILRIVKTKMHWLIRRGLLEVMMQMKIV